MNTKSNSDRLGEEPIAKLLLRLSVPSAIGLLLITSYNLVDTIFIGRLGVNAISALSIAFPIQMILAGIAIGAGVGTQSLISKSLGKKQQMKASLAAGNSILLAIFLGFITLIIGQFFSESIIRLFVSDIDVINLGAAYLRIILLGSFSLFYLRAGINILRAQGNYLLPMFILILTASLNIVLDPLLIFGLWGFPLLGVEGAAIATVLSRVISCIFVTVILISNRTEVGITFKGFTPDLNVIRELFVVGTPTMMIQLVISITIGGANMILGGSSMAIVTVAILGIYYKLQTLVLTPVFALVLALIPIIGYNYGSKNYKRIRETIKIAILFTFSVSFFAFLIFQLIPGELIKIFSSDATLIDIGTDAFRRINLLFFAVGPAVTVIWVFQGIGKGMKIFIALAIRQLIAFFPVLYFLTLQFGHPTLWLAFPIADALAIIVGIILIYPDIKKLGLINIRSIPKMKFLSR